MEMGELTTVALLANLDEECPFDHSNNLPPPKENDLVGIGTVLGDRMTVGRSTTFGVTDQGATPAPKFGATPIHLQGCKPSHLPLTCAAHHIVPAQASLRDSKLVQWLVHGSVSAQCKDGGEGTGRLAANVGYDVNGAQNGIWLPGPYALNTDTVRAGMGLPALDAPEADWESSPVEWATETNVEVASIAPAPDDAPESSLEPEDLPAPAASISAPSGAALASHRSGTAVARGMTKAPSQHVGAFPERYQYYFLYVVKAIKLVGAQYHDAHPAYSKRVKEALNELKMLTDSFALGSLCSKCKEKNKERTASSEDFPPPFGLIGKLDIISSRLRAHLGPEPSTWKYPIYTSKFVGHYFKYSTDPFIQNL